MKSIGRFERIRLYLSYQRYAFLMGGLPTLIALGALIASPRRWYLWVPLALVALKFVQVASEIYRRYPRKMRATIVARRRIARGTFQPAFVRGYCGDPCFRVVARQILRDAGMPGGERRALIEQYAREKRDEKDFVLFVDPSKGVQIRVDGSGVQNWQRPQ